MVNPFKPGDKVLILRKGIELEAVVRTTFNHEVQVRASDGELLWRTVKTARLLMTGESTPETPETPQEADANQGMAPPPPEPEAPEESARDNSPAEAPEPVEMEPAPEPQLMAPEVEAASEPKRSKKARKRDRGILRRMLTKGPFLF